MTAVRCENVIKCYGETKVLNGCSFTIEEATFTVLTGANGAGKSTLFQILCGLLPLDKGKISVCGYDPARHPREMKRKLGVVFQNNCLDGSLTLFDNLYYRAKLYGLTRSEIESKIKELSRLLESENLLRRAYGKLSGGERRKADLQRAMIHQPSLLLLDEPTAGLDARSAKEFIRYLLRLKERGVALFMISHDESDALEADTRLHLWEGVIAERKSEKQIGRRLFYVKTAGENGYQTHAFTPQEAIAYLAGEGSRVIDFFWEDKRSGERSCGK